MQACILKEINKMDCPICRTELETKRQLRLETLCEHVENVEPSLKDVYECPYIRCQGHRRIFWSSDGEYYQESFSEKFDFVNNNDAPFDSFQRQMNVEIYKHDEDYIFCTIFKWRFKIKFHYKSNRNGDILSRKRSLEIIKPDNVVYRSGIRMLKYCITSFHQNLKFDWRKREVENLINPPTWDKRWWKKCASKYARAYLWITRNKNYV